MIWSEFRAEADGELIADASVVIGLNASGQARQILELTPARVFVPDNARRELEIGKQFGHDDSALLEDLISAGLASYVGLDGAAITVYEALIDGSFGETLDDGEASVIALASVRGAVALLDERRARRICAARFPNVVQGCTAQWLLGAHALGAEAHQSAMIDALRKGRMRVPMEFVDGVVTLIGHEAASECSSLPRTARQLNATFPASTRSAGTSM
jgi:predicted nucleic acid-binding protein